MKDKYKKFYMMFDKRFKNLILCSNLNSDCGVDKGVYLISMEIETQDCYLCDATKPLKEFIKRKDGVLSKLNNI